MPLLKSKKITGMVFIDLLLLGIKVLLRYRQGSALGREQILQGSMILNGVTALHASHEDGVIDVRRKWAPIALADGL